MRVVVAGVWSGSLTADEDTHGETEKLRLFLITDHVAQVFGKDRQQGCGGHARCRPLTCSISLHLHSHRHTLAPARETHRRLSLVGISSSTNDFASTSGNLFSYEYFVFVCGAVQHFFFFFRNKTPTTLHAVIEMKHSSCIHSL